MAQLFKQVTTIKDDIKHFIVEWHDFPFDYWWRRKYNIPFGSHSHREMNFIDMYIEYQEELLLNEIRETYESQQYEIEDIELGINRDNDKVVKLSKQEIDDDYDNLDLSQFDKK